MTPTQQREFLALRNQSPRLRLSDIASRMGIPRGTAYNWNNQLLALGLVAPRKGTGRPIEPTAAQLARLSSIVSLREAGCSWADVGAALGVSCQAAHSFAHHHAPEVFAK